MLRTGVPDQEEGTLAPCSQSPPPAVLDRGARGEARLGVCKQRGGLSAGGNSALVVPRRQVPGPLESWRSHQHGEDEEVSWTDRNWRSLCQGKAAAAEGALLSFCVVCLDSGTCHGSRTWWSHVVLVLVAREGGGGRGLTLSETGEGSLPSLHPAKLPRLHLKPDPGPTPSPPPDPTLRIGSLPSSRRQHQERDEATEEGEEARGKTFNEDLERAHQGKKWPFAATYCYLIEVLCRLRSLFL